MIEGYLACFLVLGLTRRREGREDLGLGLGLGLTRGREVFGGGEFLGWVSREGAKEEKSLVLGMT